MQSTQVSDNDYIYTNFGYNMDIWLDDKEAELHFRQILMHVQQFRNGEIADIQKKHGILYKTNLGVSLVDLREIAKKLEPSHLLALKLWNRQWRETMILATLLDEPDKVTEQQMDYWTRSFENMEIAEQASGNLWYRTPYAYAKALEWCRGKKHWIRYTAVHLAGKLALSDIKSPDEMFEMFAEEFVPLSKDAALSNAIYRTMVIMANRSEYLRKMVSEWSDGIANEGSENSARLAEEIKKGIQNLV
jgi:hypothetical protein